MRTLNTLVVITRYDSYTATRTVTDSDDQAAHLGPIRSVEIGLVFNRDRFQQIELAVRDGHSTTRPRQAGNHRPTGYLLL